MSQKPDAYRVQAKTLARFNRGGRRFDPCQLCARAHLSESTAEQMVSVEDVEKFYYWLLKERGLMEQDQ